MMGEKLGFFDVLKKALTIPYNKPQFIIFTFLTSLPLFCFMVIYESIFQRTLIAAAHKLSEIDIFICYGCFYSNQLGFFERLIDEVSHEFLLLGLLYLGILHFFNLITTIATVDSSSAIYSEEKITMSLKNMFQRFISETRLKGPLITSIYALLSASLFLSGLVSVALYIYIAAGYFIFMVLCGLIFIALLTKYIELSVIWNMGVVMSVLEEKQGDVALVVSSYISRGRRQSGFLILIIFSLWNIGLRLSCMYMGGWDEGGSGLVVIAAHVSFMCLGNIVKWVCFVVYFYDCRKLARERMIDVEASNAIQE